MRARVYLLTACLLSHPQPKGTCHVVVTGSHELSVGKFIYFMYRVSMFAHFSVPKILIFSSPFFSVDPFHIVNSLLSQSYCYFLHPRISRSAFLFFFFIFFFQMGTTSKFFDVMSLHLFFVHGHINATVSYII